MHQNLIKGDFFQNNAIYFTSMFYDIRNTGLAVEIQSVKKGGFIVSQQAVHTVFENDILESEIKR